ncbi:MAG: 50S ribosomal protein L11 methyltransferase [Saprospiraceae bacterium]|nr:50S ribosomal protein L11 methyltransferase [Saprospiraceae bacterium]
MAFRQLRFSSNNEELLALLSLFPFEAFLEEEDELVGYIEEELCNPGFYSDIERLCKTKGVTFTDQEVDDVNWNREWESSFKPVVVDDFCAIKASFHTEIFDTDHTITIDPKMAFGTGHHETTYMMIDAMRQVEFNNISVLDHGCGTGVLAILAEKCGAAHIDAIDIEEESYQNTIENAQLNDCERIKSIHGQITDLSNVQYDVILANINRKVLLDTACLQYDLLKPGGYLLLSGILKEDQSIIERTYEECGFEISGKKSRGNWLCIKYLRLAI